LRSPYFLQKLGDHQIGRGASAMPGIPRRPPFSSNVKPALFKEAKIKEAMDVLKQRGVKHDYCPRCETLDWNVDLIEVLAESSVSPLFKLSPLPSPNTNFNAFYGSSSQSGVIPLMAVVCRNCGYTMFHNLDILGIPVR
jgi:hypothetical protein